MILVIVTRSTVLRLCAVAKLATAIDDTGSRGTAAHSSLFLHNSATS
jgi:hypothetical protein